MVTTSAHDKNTIEPDNNAISEWVKVSYFLLQMYFLAKGLNSSEKATWKQHK